MIDLAERLRRIRAEGWRVAVHNDYRLDGRDCTFWLFTHPDGRWVKGEGGTDADALLHVEAKVFFPQDGSIPKGVYYGAETDNFYLTDHGVGMGMAFWMQWRDRKHEFPTERFSK